jgi:hypothetical protein
MRPTGFTAAQPVTPDFFPKIRPGFLAALLLALFWWLAVSASTHWSQTSDELVHITAGYAYDKFGDYRMQPENGILPQRLHGLVPLWLGVRFNMDPVLWRNSTYWQLGWDLFYGLDNPTDGMVLGARALNALFGVALGAFIFLVARRWYGDRGGLLALGLFALCPNFLAHSALATSDLAAVLFLLLAPWFFWRHLARRDFTSSLLAGLMSGLALVAKFNGVLLAPIYLALILADPALRCDHQRGGRLARNVGLAVWQAVMAAGLIWLFYGFRYSTAAPGLPPLEAFAWPWEKLLQGIGGWKASSIGLARHWELLPEAWLYGLSTVLAGSLARPSFLAGEYSLHGWWQFFPVMFLTKTTLALLLATPVALGLGAMRLRKLEPEAQRERMARWMPLVLTAAAVWLTALTSNLNIGHRHILAVYPVLFVAAGGLAVSGGRWLALPLALFALQAVESFAIRPHYLAFFNPLGGGPEKAYRLVVDSSLDWGQDLPALREWLAGNRRPGEPFYLSYFGSAWPPHYGVRPTYFLPANYIARPPFQKYDYLPGLYCISATSLAEVYSDFKGPWRPEWTAQSHEPGTTAERRDELRFAQLCKYLRTRPPDGFAGYSILIFRLGATELRQILTP